MDINATATQLAIDADFYERKALELWDLISAIESTSVLPKLHISSSTGMMQDFPLLDLETLHSIFLSLISYYRKERLKNILRLQQLKQAQ
jgi:hypothetical protein